jgi:putative Mn2+ efflux pump MntP
MLLLLFLSFDSFVVSLGLGLLGMPPQRRYQTCLLFGLCDGLATLIGLRLGYGGAHPLRFAQTWMVSGGICVWILFVGFLAYQAALKRPIRIFVLSLPVVLAIDNLFAGSVFSGAALTMNIAPFVAAIFSTSFALVGFALSAPLGSRLTRSTAVGLAAILLWLTPILF